MSEENKSLQEQLDILKQQQKLQNDINSTQAERRELQKKIIEAQREINKEKLQSKNLTQEEYDALIKNIKTQDQEIAKIEAKNEKIKQGLEHLREQEALQNQLGKSIESLANKWRGGMVEGILEAGVNFKQLGESIKKSVTLTNLAGTAMQTVVQSTLMTATMFDQARTSFAAATGAGNAFTGVINDISDTNKRFGIGIAESAKAVGDLYNGMTLFDSQSDSVKKKLGETTARLEKFGISGATTAANLEYSMRVMGESGEEAAASAEGLAKFAMGIGVAPAKMAEEFKRAGPKLAVYGKNATKVFEGLARQSKKTGVELNSLLGIADQFDTFEGAAQAAGQLNSVLGGPYLDSTRMLYATEDERLELLKESLVQSGKQFDSMSRFEKKAFANAAGFTDMAEANNFFSESSRMAAAAQEEQSISAEELAKRQAATVSVQQKLNMLMQSFAVLVEPIVDGFRWFLETLMSINDFFGGYFMPVLAGLAVGAFLVAKGIGVAAAAVTVAGAASAPAAASISTLGPALGSAATGTASLGLASLTLIPIILSVGAVILAVGAAINLAAQGVSVLIDSFSNILPVISENVLAFPMLIAGILGLSFALIKLAAVGGPGVLVLGGVAAAAWVLGKALGSILAPVTEVSSSIGMMFEQINALREKSTFQNFIDVVAKVDTESVKNLEALMDQASRMVDIQAKLAVVDTTKALTGAVDKLISLVAPDAAGTSDENKKQIILQLNNREFARAVVDALDNDMKLSLA